MRGKIGGNENKVLYNKFKKMWFIIITIIIIITVKEKNDLSANLDVNPFRQSFVYSFGTHNTTI